jgi:hypothetical protein
VLTGVHATSCIAIVCLHLSGEDIAAVFA